jgi:hypothetical protein
MPPYRHLPGLTPHPVNHPGGHSFGAAEPEGVEGAERLPEEWQRCSAYLRGVDLFNRAYYWESHEAWEAVWHAVGKKTTCGLYLQALIQVAASLLQRHGGRLRGSRNLHRKADAKLQTLACAMQEAGAGGTYMGLAVGEWRRRVSEHLRGGGAFPFILLKPEPTRREGARRRQEVR